MSSTNYEHDCMRAELLGFEKPDKSLYANESEDTLSVETLALEGEQLGRVGGGLDELNSIILSTRKKMTRYQSFKGRLGSLIKGSEKSSPTHIPAGNVSNAKMSYSGANQEHLRRSESPCSAFKSEEVDRQVDKLDQLLMKAEYAQMSLGHNNKLIKKIIKK